MPAPRLTWPGAAAHALAGLTLAAGLVLVQPGLDYWPLLAPWLKACLLGIQISTALLLGAAALSRFPLIAEHGPLRHGWLILIGLTAAWLVLCLAVDDTMLPFWPAGATGVFLPLWVRQLEEAYQQGRLEGQAEVDARRAG